eukprot:7084063-Pyramimonas_sp.AAC.1
MLTPRLTSQSSWARWERTRCCGPEWRVSPCALRPWRSLVARGTHVTGTICTRRSSRLRAEPT